MNFKKFSLITLMIVTAFNAHSQKANQDTKKSFSDIRKSDFTRLSGIESNFEGVTVKYDQDKSTLNYGQGISLSKQGKCVLTLNGSVGTSTDLSKLLEQKILPTFSLGASFNYLLSGTKYSPSLYYYDGQFGNNYSRLGNTLDKPISKIPTGTHQIKYREQIRRNILKGKSGFSNTDTVYTSKRFLWLSITAKYNNNQYGFYDGARSFSLQQYDTSFQTLAGQFALNFYWGWDRSNFKWDYIGRPEYIFFTAYASYSKNNNIGQLNKTTINFVKETVVDTTSHTSKEILSKSQSYYSGKYIEYYNATFGGKLFVSPLQFISLEAFGEYNLIRNSDKSRLGLHDNKNWGVGVLFYTNKDSKSSINIGLEYKRTESSMTNDWTHRIGIVTSIPVNIFRQ